MHENGLALPLLAAVILVTALVSSPSHRDGSLRRGAGRTWGHRLLFEKRARALAGLGRISGSERKTSSNSSLDKDAPKI